MNDRAQDRIKGAKEILALLATFRSLPKKDVEDYIKALKLSPSQLIADLAENNLCSRDRDDNILECRGAEGSIKGTLCFRAARALAAGKTFYIREAAYPFDYVMASEGKVYRLLYFNDGGKTKLSFYNHMKKEEGEGPVPVIIFVNQPADELYEKDAEGESYLIPREPFIVSRVSYKNDSQYITFKEMGGRKDE